MLPYLSADEFPGRRAALRRDAVPGHRASGEGNGGETEGASPLCSGACLCRDGEHGAPADKRERRSRPPERGRKAEKRQERISEVTGKEKGNGANGWTDRAE